MSIQIEKYGYRRGIADHRDYIYGIEDRLHPEASLPASASERQEMPPIYDQGQLGSCTANADGGLLEHAQMAQGEVKVNPSRLFLYYEERRLGGYPLDQDTGAEVRDGIKVAAQEGVPHESDWPYDITKFAHKPPKKAYTDALKLQALVYKTIRVDGPGAPMRSAIVDHHPIAFGFPVPDTFESESWDPATMPLPLPTARTQIIGGHAVVVVGYDYSLKRFSEPVFEVRNSWGPDWGDEGHFYMPATWFDPRRKLADDLWVITHVE